MLITMDFEEAWSDLELSIKHEIEFIKDQQKSAVPIALVYGNDKIKVLEEVLKQMKTMEHDHR
jgi:hypothetical protein